MYSDHDGDHDLDTFETKSVDDDERSSDRDFIVSDGDNLDYYSEDEVDEVADVADAGTQQLVNQLQERDRIVAQGGCRRSLRRRQAVQRYQDPSFTDLMLAGEDVEEVAEALNTLEFNSDSESSFEQGSESEASEHDSDASDASDFDTSEQKKARPASASVTRPSQVCRDSRPRTAPTATTATTAPRSTVATAKPTEVTTKPTGVTAKPTKVTAKPTRVTAKPTGVTAKPKPPTAPVKPTRKSKKKP